MKLTNVTTGATTTDSDYVFDWGAAPTRNSLFAEREARILAGADITVPGYSSTIAAQMRPRTDDASNLLGQVMHAQILVASGDTTTTLVWRDGANVGHNLTGAQMIAFGLLVAAWKESIYASSWVIAALDPIPADYAADSRWP